MEENFRKYIRGKSYGEKKRILQKLIDSSDNCDENLILQALLREVENDYKFMLKERTKEIEPVHGNEKKVFAQIKQLGVLIDRQKWEDAWKQTSMILADHYAELEGSALTQFEELQRRLLELEKRHESQKNSRTKGSVLLQQLEILLADPATTEKARHILDKIRDYHHEELGDKEIGKLIGIIKNLSSQDNLIKEMKEQMGIQEAKASSMERWAQLLSEENKTLEQANRELKQKNKELATELSQRKSDDIVPERHRITVATIIASIYQKDPTMLPTRCREAVSGAIGKYHSKKRGFFNPGLLSSIRAAILADFENIGWIYEQYNDTDNIPENVF